MEHLKYRFLLILVGDKNLNCCSGLFNSDKLLIFKFANFKFYVKENFVDN